MDIGSCVLSLRASRGNPLLPHRDCFGTVMPRNDRDVGYHCERLEGVWQSPVAKSQMSKLRGESVLILVLAFCHCERVVAIPCCPTEIASALSCLAMIGRKNCLTKTEGEKCLARMGVKKFFATPGWLSLRAPTCRGVAISCFGYWYLVPRLALELCHLILFWGFRI